MKLKSGDIMAKPEAWRGNITNYPFSATVQTRFQDLDPLGHINNVAMAALFESGRVLFNRTLETRHERNPDDRWLIANVDISYLREGHFPGDVTIASGVGKVGRSSWTILSACFQDGKCVATCDCTIVWTNQEGAKPLSNAYVAELKNRMATPA